MKKLAVAIVFLCSCSWFKSDVKPGAKAVFDCAQQSVMDKARQLLPAMVGILTGGTDSWKEQAKTLGKQFGKDTLACATKVALEKIESPIQSEPNEDPEQVKKASAARARALMIEEGWVYE